MVWITKNINLIKVAFHTLGCKVNFSETSTISREFTSSHYQVVSFTSFADLYVINTCSVTENADKELRVLVKKALRKNPNAFIAAIGCYAQLKPDEIASLDGVDLVLGATEKFKIIEYVQNLKKSEPTQIYSCEIEEANFYETSYSINERSRAFLKIQDGCDYKCSYCTIPKARGISRSDSLLNVINNEINDEFGLGDTRSLQDYENLCGVDLKNMKVLDKQKAYTSEFISKLSWQDSSF